jgi:hypothetical protein
VFLVLARVAWGVFGTRHARFNSFRLNPADLLRYLKGVFRSGEAPVAGHNPASSWVAIVLMTLALGLGTTGYLMTNGGNPELYEDVHEFLANTFLLVVVLHISGVVLHSLRHRDAFALSMVDGRKQGIDPAETIPSSRRVIGVVLVAVVAAFAVKVVRNYDPGTQTLKLFGASLQLTEQEDREQGDAAGFREENGEGHDEDDQVT